MPIPTSNPSTCAHICNNMYVYMYVDTHIYGVCMYIYMYVCIPNISLKFHDFSIFSPLSALRK